VTNLPSWLKVCGIKKLRTGLEVKFSYFQLAAMVAHGVDTSSEKAFVDQLWSDEKLVDLAECVRVSTNDNYNDTTQCIVMNFKSGQDLAELAKELA
jgi:hypothetical protein